MGPLQSLIKALDPLHLKICIIRNKTNEPLLALGAPDNATQFTKKGIKIGKSQMSLLTDDKISHKDNPREPGDQLMRELSGCLINRSCPTVATAAKMRGIIIPCSIGTVRDLGINLTEARDFRGEDYKTFKEALGERRPE